MINLVYEHTLVKNEFYNIEHPCWPNGVPKDNKEIFSKIAWHVPVEKLPELYIWHSDVKPNVNIYSLLDLENNILPVNERYIFPIYLFCNLYFKHYKNIPIPIPERVVNDIKNNKACLLIMRHFEAEGLCRDGRVDMIKYQAEYYKFNLNKIIFVDASNGIEDIMAKVGIKALCYNRWQIHMPDSINIAQKQINNVQQSVLSKQLRPKKFLNFNRIPKLHRAYLVDKLITKGLDKQGIVTFGTKTWDNKPLEFTNKYAEFKSLQAVAPLKYDSDDIYKDNITDITPEAQLKCYFDIVSETLHDSEKNTIVFFSEKTWKPILGFQPFVLNSHPYSLKTLKKLGYKTFSDFIDESYDEVEDNTARINKVIEVIEHICSISDAELSDMLYNMYPILEHNYNFHLQVIEREKEGKYLFSRILNEWDNEVVLA